MGTRLDTLQPDERLYMAMGRLEQLAFARAAPKAVVFVGQEVTRYGLVMVLLWIGGMKFTGYEAQGIKGLVENSPLMNWGITMLSVQGFSNLVGVTEVLIGFLIAARPFSRRG
jgi:uncharacterized membrane protein YkgB